MKTKLGVSVGLLGALVFFAALFGGYTPVLLVAGYILIGEEDEWLRKIAIKAVALLVLFSLLHAIIGLIPDALACLSNLVSIFNGSFSYYKVANIIDLFTQALSIIKTCVFILLGIMAFGRKPLNIPVIDDLINK